jgi:flagellar FliL protein
VWNHEPLIKDTIVKEMLKQEKEQVQSAEGQEAFRQTTAQKIKERLEQETGEPLIKDMLFTQFMWY